MSPVTVAPLCALYARVSTEDQSCEMQLSELREYCQRRGWRIYGEYVDTGWSGAKRDRPQLGKLMRDAQLHRFDCIMCWKLDRFGRSVANFVSNLQDLESWGVRFMCITQSIDTDQTNPSSRLLMTILAAVAEFERAMIRERVKAGMKEAKKRGIHCGRRQQVRDRDKVLQLHLQGKSQRQIVESLSLSKGTVYRILTEFKGAA